MVVTSPLSHHRLPLVYNTARTWAAGGLWEVVGASCDRKLSPFYDAIERQWLEEYRQPKQRYAGYETYWLRSPFPAVTVQDLVQMTLAKAIRHPKQVWLPMATESRYAHLTHYLIPLLESTAEEIEAELLLFALDLS